MSTQMLVDGETVVLLPAATRYEQRDGGTETTTERRDRVQPARSRPARSARRAASGRSSSTSRAASTPSAPTWCDFESGQAIRDEIARVVPTYAGIETLHRTGDAVQWGGPRLCEGGVFPTADGKARFTRSLPLSTRRCPTGGSCSAPGAGKQFNTMVYRDVDPLTGAARDAVFVAEADAARLGLQRRRRGARALRARPHPRAREGRRGPARQRAGVLARGQRAAAAPDARRRVRRSRLQRGRRDRSRPDDAMAPTAATGCSSCSTTPSTRNSAPSRTLSPARRRARTGSPRAVRARRRRRRRGARRARPRRVAS